MRAAALIMLGCCLAAAADDRDPATAPPQRIIANAPSNAEIVCALGAGDRLVGVSSYVSYPEHVRELPQVGGLHDPDLEGILALRPDLLLQRGHNEHIAALCKRHGIRMYIDRTDSLQSLYATIDELGAILGCEKQADELVESIRSRLAELSSNPPAQRPRVLFALRSPDRLAPLTTVGRPSYLHAVIEIAGGENVFGDLEAAYPTVGLEEIIAARPDVILDAMPGASMSEEKIKELKKQWEALRTVPAVANSDIHVLTEDYVLTPSPRVTLLAERLHAIFTSEATKRDE
jgi:ABC-type Fe3+-hydroxamate transport system substrate-binding protein